ncbi:hypothetical protein GWN63_02740, partial [Candidatus Bathyarchaeota archaeon]|nr:hypothetical protein [Desulfobacterales bacterium]NIU81146.1 hypothetical protein [Candidatus Bathyarchaeota archaeon]
FNPSQHVTFHVGKTVNLNANGACIITRNPLEKGAKIKVTFREPTGGQMSGGVSSVIAQVKWCNKITEDYYKTGLFWPDLS